MRALWVLRNSHFPSEGHTTIPRDLNSAMPRRRRAIFIGRSYRKVRVAASFDFGEQRSVMGDATQPRRLHQVEQRRELRSDAGSTPLSFARVLINTREIIVE